jgi:hypothetical protein
MSSELSVSQAAWNRFADRLKEIGNKITGPTGARSPRERAEGFRYLVRLLSAGHQLDMEGDARFPVMGRMMTPMRKFKGDGPDTLYHEAKIDAKRRYELEVERGDDLFFAATVYGADERGATKIVSNLFDHELAWEEGGRIARIHVSAERPAGERNWLRIDGGSPVLFTRQYFPEPVTAVDAGRYREAHLRVRCLDALPPLEPYSEEALAAGLERLLRFVDETSDVSIGLSVFAQLNMIAYDKTASGKRVDMTHIRDGEMIVDLPRDDAYSPADLARMVDPRLIANNLPGPGIHYQGAWYRLAEDEAIAIEGTTVPCRYWSCQILTRYLESGDFRHFRIALNDRQVKTRPDGSFTIYASAQDPGVDNWISTMGSASGHIVLRTLLPEKPMQARFSVVKLADVVRGGR